MVGTIRMSGTDTAWDRQQSGLGWGAGPNLQTATARLAPDSHHPVRGGYRPSRVLTP